MRRSLPLLLLCAALYGAVVYNLKFEVGQLESKLSATQRQLIAEKESIHILRAELAYITRPEQIAKLSGRHLELSPIQVTQIYELADVVPGVAYSSWASDDSGDAGSTVLASQNLPGITADNTMADPRALDPDFAQTPVAYEVQ
jgi:hypothetical protein